MPKLIESHIGTLIKATDKRKNIYFDWRRDFYAKRGIILVYESMSAHKGKYIIRFMPMDEDGNISEDALKTTYGDLFYDYVDHRIGMSTNNSMYYFEEVKFHRAINNANSIS